MNNTQSLWRGGQLQAQITERDMRAMEALYSAQFHPSRNPHRLAQQLEEIDSQLLDLIIQQRGWTRIGGMYGKGPLNISNTDRLAEVGVARWQTYYDTQSKNAMQTWTDFGFGQSVEVVPRDTGLPTDIWREFWTAQRNRAILGERVLHEQSNEAIKAGELFYPMWTDRASGLEPGRTTIRTIRTEEIMSIESLPDDPMINVWYVQSVEPITLDGGNKITSIAYRDWLATDEQVEAVPLPDGAADASGLRPNTSVVMLYAARNRYLVDNKQMRGFPEFKQAYEWFRAYKDALGDILAKNKHVAMFVDKLNIKGGSRALDGIKTQLTSTLGSSTNRLEQNPAPVAGSTWLQNEQVDRTRMPLGTGAQDDRASTMLVLGQGSAGTKVPLGWSGRPDSWQNRSVAEMTILPWNETMQRYQSWWASIFRDMAQIVFIQSGANLTPEQMEVDVTLDTLITVAVDELLAVIGGVTDAASKGVISIEQASGIISQVAQLALTKFGIAEADQVMEPEEGIARIVQTAAQNLSEGNGDAQSVAEWALAELLEVVGG